MTDSQPKYDSAAESLSVTEAQSTLADTVDTLNSIRSVKWFKLFFHSACGITLY